MYYVLCTCSGILEDHHMVTAKVQKHDQNTLIWSCLCIPVALGHVPSIARAHVVVTYVTGWRYGGHVGNPNNVALREDKSSTTRLEDSNTLLPVSVFYTSSPPKKNRFKAFLCSHLVKCRFTVMPRCLVNVNHARILFGAEQPYVPYNGTRFHWQ